MDEFCEIRWTTDNLDEARKVARYLVQERLVAQAQIIPWLESIAMLDNTLNTTQCSQVSFITRTSLYEKVREVITDNTSYEVPEILRTPVPGGNSDYLDWMRETTSELEKV